MSKLTVTAADKTVDYDGEAHGITVTGLEGTNLKVYYGESASWCNSASYTKTNAGVYEIFYKVVAGDYPYNKLDNYEITNATGSAEPQFRQIIEYLPLT